MIRQHGSPPGHKGIICLIVLFLSITASCAKSSNAPSELIGIWKASDVRYRGTSFEINENAITFLDKNGDRNTYTIVEIKRENMPDKKWVLYTLRYLDSHLKTTEFPFYFRSSKEAMIRFKHQPSLIWKQDPGFVS